MEESLYRFHNLDHRSPNINLFGAQVCVGHPNNIPAYMKQYYNDVSPNGSTPSFAPSGPSLLRSSQADYTGNGFSSLPRFHQPFGTGLSSVPEEYKLPTGTNGKNDGHGNLTGTSQKQFLVFDQSGNQTTLLYSSRIATPIQPVYPCYQEFPANCNWRNDMPFSMRNTVSPLDPFLAGVLDEHQNDGAESEMHEDTEELNALLYSDDDYSENEEETSTGHSPSTMTAHRVQCLFNAEGEEVASCAGTTKRKKPSDGGYSMPSAILEVELGDTASSLKCASRLDSEDDAESSCGNSGDQFSRGSGSLSGNKRSRKENICDTIRILQKVIPNAQGKDTVDVIDEAIQYLKSLKAKAKDLGLDAL